MHFSSSLLLPFAAVASAAQFHKRQDTSSFQLYAYGENIGGLPLVSTGDSIYIGDAGSVNNTEAAPVVFTADSDGTWHGSPNTTAANGDSPTWTDLNFVVPDSASSSHDVLLVQPNNTDGRVSSGFGFYGTVAFLFPSDGSFLSSWSGIPTEIEGVYTLVWNQTDTSTGAVPLTLKSTQPSNP